MYSIFLVCSKIKLRFVFLLHGRTEICKLFVKELIDQRSYQLWSVQMKMMTTLHLSVYKVRVILLEDMQQPIMKTNLVMNNLTNNSQLSIYKGLISDLFALGPQVEVNQASYLSQISSDIYLGACSPLTTRCGH